MELFFFVKGHFIANSCLLVATLENRVAVETCITLGKLLIGAGEISVFNPDALIFW